MYGIKIPKDYLNALRLDKIIGNTKWQDCTKLGNATRVSVTRQKHLKDRSGIYHDASEDLPHDAP